MNNRVNLHDIFKKRSFDHGLISTFSFSPRFFEEYALESFKALRDNNNLTVYIDRGQYEEIIEMANSSKGWSPRLANLRYLLHPISVPGVFHPKVFLFANKTRGLLVIGSANFSQNGLGSNAELVSTFEFERDKNEAALPLFQEAFQFFEGITEKWPSKEVKSNILDLKRSAPWLTEQLDSPRDQRLPVLLNNLTQPLWPQLLKNLPGPLNELSLVSRYFDASPKMLETITQGMDKVSLKIYTQAKLNTMGGEWLEHSMYQDGRMKIHLCQYEDGEHTQILHGKAYAFRCGSKIVMACGSANFSTAALLRYAGSGNVETLLLYPAEAVGRVSVSELFDPLGTAKLLNSAEQLGYKENEPNELEPRAHGLEDIIKDAVLDECSLTLEFRNEVAEAHCRIIQAKIRPYTFKLSSQNGEIHRIDLAPELARRMSTKPSVVQLGVKEDDEWKATSNPVLVVARYGDDAARKFKQHRRQQEAIESPERFMSVLSDLCESDDETSLRNFLNYCDIPIEMQVKAIRKGRSRSGLPPKTPTEFRNLRERNLRHFYDLHEGTMSFLARHRRKLEKHIKSGTVAGVPNYLHILESMLRLLHSQIQRAVLGLESDSEIILSPEDWKNTRDHLSRYYLELSSLLRITSNDYVTALMKEEKRADVCSGFSGAVDDILDWISDSLKMRMRIDYARSKSLKVNALGGVIDAVFFKTLISDEKWRDYVESIIKDAAKFRSQLGA